MVLITDGMAVFVWPARIVFRGVMRLGDEGDDEHEDDVGVKGQEDFEDFLSVLRAVSAIDDVERGTGAVGTGPFFDICMAK